MKNEEVLNDLEIALKEKVSTRLAQFQSDLEKEVAAELVKTFKELGLDQMSLVYRGGTTDLDVASKFNAEMFVNNAITEASIDADPSGDWDGYNRAEFKYMLPEED